MTIDPRITNIAAAQLTTRQLTIWLMSVNEGMSQRGIAYQLDIGRTTVTDTLDAAWRTLRKHGIMSTPDGRPYLEEHTRR
jgi:DNA-binding NarL/FixJ family response regulator